MERVPCDPTVVNTERCAVYRKIGKCFMDIHHLYHPRRDYKTKDEKEFRELDENKVNMCRDFHNMDHAVFPPPDKPDAEFIADAIKRVRKQ